MCRDISLPDSAAIRHRSLISSMSPNERTSANRARRSSGRHAISAPRGTQNVRRVSERGRGGVAARNLWRKF